jgi:hypothetical protein
MTNFFKFNINCLKTIAFLPSIKEIWNPVDVSSVIYIVSGLSLYMFLMFLWKKYSKIIKMLFRMSFLTFVSTLFGMKKFKSCSSVYIVSYYHGCSLYKIPVIVDSDIHLEITRIFDEYGNDMKNEILPYLGPSYDCHNWKLTPSFFNRKEITIEWIDETIFPDGVTIPSNKFEKTFGLNDSLLIFPDPVN